MMGCHPGLDCIGNGRVINQGAIHQFGTDNLGHVTLSRPEAARRNDDIGPGKGRLQDVFHTLGVIADRRMIDDEVSHFIELFR